MKLLVPTAMHVDSDTHDTAESSLTWLGLLSGLETTVQYLDGAAPAEYANVVATQKTSAVARVSTPRCVRLLLIRKATENGGP